VTVDIPPPSRNHRTPTASDTPANLAASTVVIPSPTANQNTTRSSRRPADGRPGERITGRPVICVAQPFGLPIATPQAQALRRPVESAQYLSYDYSQVLDDHKVLASVGTVGDAYDNALAESFVDSFKTELIRDRVWRTRGQMELAVLEYVHWFNHDRLHESLGDVAPAEVEHAYRTQLPTTPPGSSLLDGSGSGTLIKNTDSETD
jgi:hypothetical protein